MSRLTKKKEKYNMMVGDRYEPIATTREINNKLGELEDLEEELGCPLDVIHKAMMNGFYDSKTHTFYDSKNYDIKYCVDRDGINYARIEAYEDISKINDNIYTLKCCIDVWCSDYKKTWWLKKDKSE